MRALGFGIALLLVSGACIPPQLSEGAGGAVSSSSSATGPGSTVSATSSSATTGSGGATSSTASSAASAGGATASSSAAAGGAGGTGGMGGGMPLAAPSCVGQPGADNGCGPNHNVNCCDTIFVPGGVFNRSNDPASPATVSGFWLDRYEVTVGRFRALINSLPTQMSPPVAGYGARPAIANSGWANNFTAKIPTTSVVRVNDYTAGCATPNYTMAPGANENLPINCVDWWDAFLFCAADGGYLPTEAEWNFAAAGGTDQRLFPWGATMPDMTLATFGGVTATDVGTHSPAGDGKWGHSDLAGNAREWTLDYDAAYPLPCMDCAQTTQVASTSREMRGGSAVSINPAELQTVTRDPQNADINGTTRGIRCVRF